MPEGEQEFDAVSWRDVGQPSVKPEFHLEECEECRCSCLGDPSQVARDRINSEYSKAQKTSAQNV